MFFSTVAVAAFAALAAASPVKRDFGGRATYYATGLGACGQYSSDSDFIVALNAPQYGSGYPGPECFKQIQISANGKTATATIMDLCPGCGYGDLDMSPALFNHFADPSVGVFQMNWDYVGSAPATSEAPQTSSTPEPSSTWVAPSTSETPSSTWVAPTTSETPSSTWVAPSTTAEASSSAWVASSSSVEASSSAWVAPSSSVASSSAWVAPSSSAQASSSAWTAPSSSAAPSSVISSVAAPIPTITVELGNQTIAELYAAVAQMGELVIVGAYNGSIINASSLNATSFTNATATPLGNTTILFQ